MFVIASQIPRIFSSARALAAFTLLCGVAYPLASVVVARALFPEEADGSLVMRGGVAIGSALVAQRFTAPEFFHSRPSAADFATVASGASNLSPASPEFRKVLEKRAAELGTKVGKVPFDMLTASGSGLDPHISREAAMWQIPRIAHARGIPEAVLVNLVEANVFPLSSAFAKSAPLIVNVLQLNVALVERH